MKKLVFLFTVFTFLFFTSSVQATTILTDNQLLIFNDKVITKDSSIEQINNMFGKPKVITESAFGGNAYSYYNDDGIRVTGWQNIENNTYYFDNNGVMKKGIQEIDGKKYFLGVTKGKMMKGWLEYEGLTYYMDLETGEMASNVTIIDGKAYFFGITTNKLMKGLISYGGNLYYANEEGKLQTGNQVINGKVYYFDENTYQAI